MCCRKQCGPCLLPPFPQSTGENYLSQTAQGLFPSNRLAKKGTVASVCITTSEEGLSVLSNLQGLVRGSIKTQQGPSQTLRELGGTSWATGLGAGKAF